MISRIYIDSFSWNFLLLAEFLKSPGHEEYAYVLGSGLLDIQ